jgi:LysM repeat protein
MSSSYPYRRLPQPEFEENVRGRVIPFERARRFASDLDEDAVPRPLRRSPDESEADRPTRRRRPRSWLRRNAISIVGVGFLLVLLGVGFGVMQLLSRADRSEAASPPAAPTPVAAAGVDATSPAVAALEPTATTRDIQASAQTLEPNYTVQSGDTLNLIAQQFNTTVARIAALNDLADPRALRIGQKLVIPPPL